MLMLTRREGEKLIITHGETEIVVLVQTIKRSQVSIGIQAPRSVTVLREEVEDRRRGAWND